MFYTLGLLKESINRQIEKKGENSPVAAFIFTEDDVVMFDEKTMNEVHYSNDVVEQVLDNVGESDYLYEQILDLIEDEIKLATRNSI